MKFFLTTAQTTEGSFFFLHEDFVYLQSVKPRRLEAFSVFSWELLYFSTKWISAGNRIFVDVFGLWTFSLNIEWKKYVLASEIILNRQYSDRLFIIYY